MSFSRETRIRSARSVSYTHRRRWSKRGPRTIAKAVPQLPAPMMANRGIGKIGARGKARAGSSPASERKDVLLTSVKPLDVRFMFVDDKQAGDQRGSPNRPGGLKNEPHRHRKDRRSHNRRQRNEPRPGDYPNKYDECRKK